MIPQAAVAGRRACALLAACSAVLHAITVARAESPAAAVLMVGMAAACLYCARDLWLQSALRTWVLVAVMNILMIATHTPFGSGHHHEAGAAIAANPMLHSTAMTLAMALAAVEAVIATAVVYQRSRRNRAQVVGAQRYS